MSHLQLIYLLLVGFALAMVAWTLYLDGLHTCSRRLFLFLVVAAVIPLINVLIGVVLFCFVLDGLRVAERWAKWWRQPLVRKKP